MKNKNRFILPILTFLSFGMVVGAGFAYASNSSKQIKKGDADTLISRVYFSVDSEWMNRNVPAVGSYYGHEMIGQTNYNALLNGKNYNWGTDQWDSISNTGIGYVRGRKYAYWDNFNITTYKYGYEFQIQTTKSEKDSNNKKSEEMSPVSDLSTYNAYSVNTNYYDTAWGAGGTRQSGTHSTLPIPGAGEQLNDILPTPGRVYIDISSISTAQVENIDFFNSSDDCTNTIVPYEETDDDVHCRSDNHECDEVDILDGNNTKRTIVTVPWNATHIQVHWSLGGSGYYASDKIQLPTNTNKIKNQINITGVGNSYSLSIPQYKIGDSVYLLYTGWLKNNVATYSNIKAKFFYNYYMDEETAAVVSPTVVSDSRGNDYLKYDVDGDYKCLARFYNSENTSTYDTGVFALTSNENIYYSSSGTGSAPTANLFGPELGHLSEPTYNSARLILKKTGSGVWGTTPAIGSDGSITYNAVSYLVGVRTWVSSGLMDNDSTIYPVAGFTDNDSSTNKYAYVDLPYLQVAYLQFVVYKEVGDTAAVYYATTGRITVSWTTYCKCQLITGSSDDSGATSDSVVTAGANLMEVILNATDTCSSNEYNGYGTTSRARATNLLTNYYANSGKLTSEIYTLEGVLPYEIDNVMTCIVGRQTTNNPKYGSPTNVEIKINKTNNSNLLIVVIIGSASILSLVILGIFVLKKKENKNKEEKHEA